MDRVRFPAVPDRSYPYGIVADFPEVKRPGFEADHSFASRTEARNGGAIPPLPHTPSRRSAAATLYYYKKVKNVKLSLCLTKR
jgi:hypothetical protein